MYVLNSIFTTIMMITIPLKKKSKHDGRKDGKWKEWMKEKCKFMLVAWYNGKLILQSKKKEDFWCFSVDSFLSVFGGEVFFL